MTGGYRPRRQSLQDSRRPVLAGLLVVGGLAVLLAAGTGGYLLFRSDPSVPGTAPAVAPTLDTPTTPPVTPAESPPVSTPDLPPSAPGYDLRESVTIESVPNFRDVAGGGIPLDGNARMATGLVYRSGKLSTLSAADRSALSKAGVTQIYDLRTTRVAHNSPDPAIKGATYHLVNIYAVESTPAAHPTSVGDAEEHLRELNRAFVTKAAQRERIASLLESIARDDGPVVVHCTEGKDRTGWVSALLQYIAGADSATVLDQYLLSNQERAGEIEKSYAKVKKASGAKAADIARALKSVDASYLGAGLSQVEDSYGSLDAYLREGLGLTQATLDALRSKLRVEPRPAP